MKKKIFLIHPVLGSDRTHTLVYRKGYGMAIPLGLAYISGELIRHNYDVNIYDYQTATRDIAREIDEFRPDIFGISVCTPAAKISENLAELLRRKYPATPIIAGGPHITTFKKDIFNHTNGYDFLVIGEGEKTTVELVNEIFSGRKYPKVEGICYKEDGKVIETSPRGFIKNLDELCYLPLHLFHYAKYIPTPGTFTHLPSIAYLSSRGCPFSCVFCNKSMFGNTLRQMSANRIIDEIAYLKKRYNIREINFFDDTFTANKNRVFEFCEKMIRAKLDVKWKCDSRVNTVTREMLLLMKKAGCFSMSFGVESGDDEILKKIKKGITTEQIRNAFTWSKEAGIYRNAFFMLNLPGDTKTTIEKTIRFSREIKPDYVSFELTKPLPGTEIRKALRSEKHVVLKEELWNDWESCTISNKIFYTQNDLSEAYLSDAFNRALKSFYLSPLYILKSILRMRTLSQLKPYLSAAVNIIYAKVPSVR